MKINIFKFFFVLIIISIFIYGFSSSYSLQNIDNLNYVVAIIIDKAKTPNMINVTFEFVDVSNFSSDSASQNSSPILETISSPTIDGAINIMKSYSGKGINLSTCKVVIISNEIAEEGVYEEISDLINSAEIRPSVNVIVTTGSAKEYVDNSSSPLEKVLTKYYEIFPNSTKYSAYTSNITIGEFYEKMRNPHIGNLAILGGVNENSSKVSESEDIKADEIFENQKEVTPAEMVPGNTPISGQRGNENFGLAVFKDDKYIGNLTALEALCHSVINDETDFFNVSVSDPNGSDKKIVLDLYKTYDTKIDVDVSHDNPIINLNVYLEARISSVLKDLDYSDPSTIQKLESSSKEYIESIMKNYLYKTSKDYKADVNGFFEGAKKKFMTNDELENYDWRNKYPNAEFNVNVDLNVISSLLVKNN